MNALGWVNAGIGAISSFANMIGQNRAIDKQIKAQKEENQKNREYNLMLAQTQNRWNIEQWQRENDYNSPTAQMSRYKEAGLNPNLIYDQQNLSASSPTLTSGQSSAPQDMSALGQKRNFGQAMQEALNMELQRAQIENIRANTRNTDANTDKTGEETKSLTIDNMYKAAREQMNLSYQGIQIQLGKSTLDLNAKQMEVMQSNIEKVAAEISAIEQSNKESIARIASMDINNAIALARNAREDKQLDLQIQASYDAHRQALVNLDISKQQYKEMVISEGFRMAGMKEDVRIKSLQAAGIEIDNNNKLLQGINIDLQNKSMSFDAARNQYLADSYAGKNGIGNATYAAGIALLHDVGNMLTLFK